MRAIIQRIDAEPRRLSKMWMGKFIRFAIVAEHGSKQIDGLDCYLHRTRAPTRSVRTTP